MQGQADRELCTGQSRRNSNGKASSLSSKYSCQRTKRCSALEPVLEHCELAIHVAKTCNTSLQPSSSSSSSSKGKSTLRILSRLRDSYVKLMNDVATGADLAGMSSSFYGAGFSGSGAGDYASLSPNARSRSNVNKEAEKEQPFASPPSASA